MVPRAFIPAGSKATRLSLFVFGQAKVQKNMHYFWHNNSTSVKVCVITTIGATAYLFFVDGESFAGWTIFFIALALSILLHTIDEQHKELETLRHPKKEVEVDEKKEPVDPRSYDPFYISDANNPNRHKIMKDGNVDENIKK